jgi:uncharacterized membrane protein
MSLQAYLRALDVGAACGLRTLSGPAVTLWKGGSGWAWLAGAGELGELVADKLPSTPARTEPGPLIARIVSGGLCGAALCGRYDASRAVGAVCGAVGAIASAFAGYTIRRQLTVEFGWPDLPVAIAEDGLAFTMAFTANAGREDGL